MRSGSPSRLGAGFLSAQWLQTCLFEALAGAGGPQKGPERPKRRKKNTCFYVFLHDLGAFAAAGGPLQGPERPKMLKNTCFYVFLRDF